MVAVYAWVGVAEVDELPVNVSVAEFVGDTVLLEESDGVLDIAGVAVTVLEMEGVHDKEHDWDRD